MSGTAKRWRIIGVDRESGYETSIIYSATSAAVARIMAERKGMVVAEVIDLDEGETGTIGRELERELEERQPDVAPTLPRAPRRGDIICPNPHCRYVGPPAKKARGSVAVGCLLSLFFLLP